MRLWQKFVILPRWRACCRSRVCRRSSRNDTWWGARLDHPGAGVAAGTARDTTRILLRGLWNRSLASARLLVSLCNSRHTSYTYRTVSCRLFALETAVIMLYVAPNSECPSSFPVLVRDTSGPVTRLRKPVNIMNRFFLLKKNIFVVVQENQGRPIFKEIEKLSKMKSFFLNSKTFD